MQISANHLKIGYDDKIVVPDFDVVIHKHDITTFIGPNGCGKSTILKALTRILKCGGVIEIDGNSIHTMPTKEVAKKIAILSQQQTMPPDITVEELVGFGRMPYQKAKHIQRDRQHQANYRSHKQLVPHVVSVPGINDELQYDHKNCFCQNQIDKDAL